MLRKLLLITALPFVLMAHADDKPVAVGDLPDAVINSIAKEYPNSKILKAEEDSKAGLKYYEVKIQDGNVQREIYIRPGGTIFKKELDDED